MEDTSFLLPIHVCVTWSLLKSTFWKYSVLTFLVWGVFCFPDKSTKSRDFLFYHRSHFSLRTSVLVKYKTFFCFLQQRFSKRTLVNRNRFLLPHPSKGFRHCWKYIRQTVTTDAIAVQGKTSQKSFVVRHPKRCFVYDQAEPLLFNPVNGLI